MFAMMFLKTKFSFFSVNFPSPFLLTDLARPMLLMSGVVDLGKDYLTTAEYRVSKNCWMEEVEFPEMKVRLRKLSPGVF